MIEEYRKEEKIIERNEFQKEEDLIKIIIKTRRTNRLFYGFCWSS